MRIVGLVGGTTWVSTAEYYRYMNEETNRRSGGSNFAECVLYSLDFGKIKALMKSGREEEVFPLILGAARRLERAGAEALALCANTMHMFVDRLEAELSVPIIHIAEATGREIRSRRITTVALLGTRLTMERDFYKKKLRALGIETIIPDPEDRDFVDRSIFEEFARDSFEPETKRRYLDIVERLRRKGAQGIVLGCTEIPLLLHDGDADLPLFNTTFIHARAIVDFALGES